MRQPELAATLRLLVRRGPEGFYAGEVARAVAEEMRAGGGVMTEADLAAYRPEWREPLRGWFRGGEVISMPPPSSGGIVLLQVLAVLDGFPLDAERRAALDRAAAEGRTDAVGLGERAVHWWIEALRRAFADRAAHMGDPDHYPVPQEELLDPDWIAERRISIGELAQPDVQPWASPPPVEGSQTTHLSVLDDRGGAVSLTTTLKSGFGSGLVVGGAGFLLNNEIDDFSIQPGVPNVYGLVGGEANAIRPGKRPLSSMTPAILREPGGAVTMVIGSPGGPRIITAVLEVILRAEVYGQSIAEAVEAPRLHQQWKPEQTFFEPGWDPELLDGLRARGHLVEEGTRRWASVQAIQLAPGGQPQGASDSRRGGSALAQ